ncbi:hypothetical protein [Mesorhizobium sp. ES1-1]|uniref:hypothetical protein n=1 Tax=Mesorhizobium sp. ES1-1 TaxID=2876629 RepID=UPI001CCEEDBB|nr:hypothetical protein [Mesorhizobium sp. ES1-1]MBZ9674558.1 hypothetical protein [Mesorhizobium sp. ES1-1]
MTTYNELRVKVGRRPITVVELDLDFCNNVYGTAPCTAAVGVTGTQKCFNTYPTCQDAAHYSRGTKTYKFTEANSFLPIGETVYPCISDVDIAPTQLKPGAFSVSAAVTVTLDDFPHHDRGVDPYIASRSYDARNQGTFFGKLKARNAIVTNRVMRVNTGYIDANRTVYTLTRTYFIDRIEGPDANGRVKIVGKDLLRFDEIEKTKMPRQPTATLTAGAPPNSTFNVSMSPAGVGATLPSGTFLIALDDEILNVNVSPGDILSASTRHEYITTALAHGAGTVVREVFPNATGTYRPVQMIRDLLLAAGIDSSYIPYSAWQTECDAYIDPTSVETVIVEQESVKTLIEELLTDFGCALWWDELDAQLKFKVLSTGASSIATLRDVENILEGSMTVKVLEKERMSRVQVSYGMVKKYPPYADGNFASAMTPDVKNMSKSALVIDTVAESPNAYAGAVPKEIVSRWLGFNAGAEATAVANRYLARYGKTLREVAFQMDAKDSHIRTGDVVNIVSRLLQAPDGSQQPVKFIITQFRETVVGSQYSYTALELPA